jgi:hypothetical protein
MYRKLGAVALAASMFVSSAAVAATATKQGALAPGKPATVKKAQTYRDSPFMLYLLGGTIVVGGAVLVLTGNGNGTSSTTTTGAPH